MTPKRDFRKDLRAIRMPTSFMRQRLPGAATTGERASAPRKAKATGVGGEGILPKRPITRNLWLAIWLVVVISVSQVFLYVNPRVGVYINAAALGSLIYLALKLERARQLTIAVSIIPVAMLFGLSLPAATVFQRTTATAAIILVLGLVYQYLFTLDYPVIGTKLKRTRHGYAFAIPLMIVLGQFIGLIGFALLHNQYDFRDVALPLVFPVVILFAISEEILFRGLIQQRAMTLLHPIVAAALSAVLYTLLTIGQRGGTLAPIVGALIGLACAAVYYRKQNLLLTISVNAAAKLTYIGLVAVFVLR